MNRRYRSAAVQSNHSRRPPDVRMWPRGRSRALSRALRLGGALAGLMVLAAVLAAPAAAEVVDRDSYSGSDTSTYGDCGYPVDVQEEFSGHYLIRAGKHRDDSAFFLTDNYSFRATHTNAETGAWFVVRGNGVFKDVKSTRVEGDVFEFVTMDAGQPFVVEDSDCEGHP